jgi:RNA polymerase sigma-70 factor (ECF subfamily)
VLVSEQELVRRARGGEAEAFGALVGEHQQFVFNLALRTVNDPAEAEDIAQEAFVRAWQALPNFRGQAQFRTWLYRIVTNLCYNRLPRLRRELAALGEAEAGEWVDDTPTGADPARSAEAAEQRTFLHQQIAALPESYRLLVTLRFQQELSYEEIASVTSLPLGTVKTGLFRARAKLKEALQEYEHEP